MQPNALYYGDCLDWMGRWDDATVDLIYLDPPFNSQANYNVLFGKAVGGAQYRAFTDTWHWDTDAAQRFDAYRSAIARPAHAAIVGLETILGPSGMLSYLTYMAERLEHCHRLLKPTGSFYLHCDPTAGHYLKIVLDSIFGTGNFRTEVTWQRSGAHNDSRQWGRVADSILFYSRGSKWTWNRQYVPYSREYIEQRYRYLDEDGRRHWRNTMTASGQGPARVFRGQLREPPPGTHWRFGQEQIDQMDQESLIYYSKSGMPYVKSYLDERKGRPVQNIWTDVVMSKSGKERLGYATQKPLALMKRIIEASSNPGDVVLDPFCGCGTTVEAAQKLGRPWLGIDISPFAIDVIRERRLQDSSIPAYGIPYDLAGATKLAAERPFAFETWAVTRLNGFVPNTKQVADGGVDGRGTVWEQPDADVTRLALAQVKGGHFSLSHLRDFNHVIDRDRAALGCYLTVDRVDTHAARAETAGMGNITVGGATYPRLQRWSMAEYFDQRPPLLPLMADPYTGKPMQMRLV